MHPHTLTAWPTPLNPESPRSPRTPPFPAFRASSFGGTGGDFDPSKFDFSQIDLGQVMRMLQSTGPVNWEIARQTAEWVALEGGPEPPVSAARPRAVRGARARGADARGGRDRSHRDVRHRARAPSAPKGWVDLHLVALRPVLEAMAATLGDAMQQVGDDDEDDDIAGAGGFPGVPGMAGLAGMGNMMGLLAPALLGRAGGLDDRLPRAARARPLRPPAAHRAGADRRLPRWRRAHPVLRRAQHRRVRGGVVAPARRPALLRRAARDRARGGPIGPMGARPARRAWPSTTCRATRSTRRRSKRSSG